MQNYKIISIDMFQTLVDVNSRRYEVFKKILGDYYTPNFAEECWNDANVLVFEYFSKHVNEECLFRNTKSIFEDCFQRLYEANYTY